MLKKILPIALVIALLLGAVGFCVYDRRAVFVGERVGDPDGYTLRFEKMNGSDAHGLWLRAGDRLAVEFAIERGRADLTVGIDGEKPLYRGDDLNAAAFELVVPAGGFYRISVNAKHAAGSIGIRVVSAAGA